MCRKRRGLRDEIDQKWKRREKGELKAHEKAYVCIMYIWMNDGELGMLAIQAEEQARVG